MKRVLSPNRDLINGAGPALSVVVVNYNSWDDCVRLITSLAQSREVRGGLCEVIVVDNASAGPIPALLRNPPEGVQLILRSHNDGFAAGVNAGWRASDGRWLLLLNPDIVADADLLGRILARVKQFEARPDGPPGIVGFKLRNADGTHQPSVGHEPNLLRSMGGVFLPRASRKYRSSRKLRAGNVSWVTGACLLVDSDVLDRLNGMDEEFFLYYEEVALCRSARLLGRGVEFDPSVEVTHLHPLQNRAISPKMRVITRHSKLLYFRKHRNRYEFASLTRVVAAEANLRGFWSRLTGRLDHAEAWRTIGALARAMRRGDSIRGRDVLRIAERGQLVQDSRARTPHGRLGGRVVNAPSSAITDGRTIPAGSPGRVPRTPASSAHCV